MRKTLRRTGQKLLDGRLLDGRVKQLLDRRLLDGWVLDGRVSDPPPCDRVQVAAALKEMRRDRAAEEAKLKGADAVCPLTPGNMKTKNDK